MLNLNNVVVPLALFAYIAIEVSWWGAAGAAVAVLLLQQFFEVTFLYATLTCFLLARVFAARIARPGLVWAATAGGTVTFTALALSAMTGVIEPWHAVAFALVLYYVQGRIASKRRSSDGGV